MRQFFVVLRHQSIGFTALCVALSGTAYAATALPKNSVTSSTVKNASLTTADIKNGSLLREDFKAGQLAGGGQGAAGPVGAKGDPGTNGTNGVNGTNGSNGTNGIGATGAAGVTGPAGAVGVTGPTGAAGSARAFGRIDGVATTAAVLTTPPAVGLGAVTKITGQVGAYCVATTAGLTPANAVMLPTPDADGSTSAGFVQVDGDGNVGCPNGAFVVRTFNKNGDATALNFTVMVP